MRRAPMLVFAATAAATLPAQQTQEPAPPARTQQAAADGTYVYEWHWFDSRDRDDYRELHLMGGFRFMAPGMQLDVRGTNAIVLLDLEGAHAVAQAPQPPGLPHRGVPPPEPRRRLSPEQVRARIDHTLRAAGQPQGPPAKRSADQQIDLLRYLYCEGGVTVVREGVEVVRCERMWISPLDDRIVVEEAELRYHTPGKGDRGLLVVRGPRLVKEGGRWTGRDLVITTCTAEEPHFALAVGEAEILERDGEFEVVVRGQSLQMGGTSVLPLPDARFFTGSQSEFPIKSASAGYSSKEGVRGGVVLGLPWNRTGGAMHEFLTGRPANEFRGEWELGVGWIEERGVPLEGSLTYGAKDLYKGRTTGFWLDDHGENLREIQTNFDGTPIDTEDRGLVSSENRVLLGESSHVDLVAFHATDPAVLSEFFGGKYRNEEVPETSAYLHHGAGNKLLTVGGRWNLDEFSYADNRSLAPKFTEELPVVTFDWIAQPLFDTPWGTPIVVDMSTDVGERRSNYDDRAAPQIDDSTFRADQLVEVSAPFLLGALSVRPYASGRGTWYDDAIDGQTEGRMAAETGVQVGTRLSRTWLGLGEDGADAMRHVIAPKITYRNRFHVDDDPSQFFFFDEKDALTERELVRVEVRNLLQRMDRVDGGPKAPRDFVLFDLAQDYWPEADRDNGGDEIGLLYYDLLIRPRPTWLPVETLAFAVYGDYDWDDGMRTLDTELQVGRIAGITWTADYREDNVTDGAVGMSASTQLLDRWNLYAGAQRDLQVDEWLEYSFGLVRHDHDWSISLSAGYNPYSDETTFRLEFLPRLPGMDRGRLDRLGDGRNVGNFATNY